MKAPFAHFLRVQAALVIREMITRYGRSWIGYAWAVIEPLGVVLILSIAISQIVPIPALGSSFVLFYATGYIPFHFFLEAAQSTGTAVQLNRALMQLPMVTPLDTVLARFFLSCLTLMIVAAMLFSGLLWVVEEPVDLRFEGLALGLGAGAILGLGVGTTNAFLFEVFPSWRQLWGIISRPLFIISGVFFVYEGLPRPLAEPLWYNPILHVVGQTRSAIYPFYDAAYVQIGYPIALGLGLFLLGGLALTFWRNRFVEFR